MFKTSHYMSLGQEYELELGTVKNSKTTFICLIPLADCADCLIFTFTK